MTTFGAEGMRKAGRACTCCHEARRVLINGVWICTRCDDIPPWERMNRKP